MRNRGAANSEDKPVRVEVKDVCGDLPILETEWWVMADMSIREATSSDIQSLCRLYYEFHEFHARAVPERLITQGSLAALDDSELSTTLQTIIDDERAIILVAEVDGQKVGLVEAYIRHDEAHPLRRGYRYGHLQSLMVAKGCRGRGVGRRLIEAAEEWTKGHGAREMRLDTWEAAGDPVGFYEKVEYRTLRRTMVHVL